MSGSRYNFYDECVHDYMPVDVTTINPSVAVQRTHVNHTVLSLPHMALHHRQAAGVAASRQEAVP